MINDPAEARRIEDLLLNATQPAQQLQYDGWLLRMARNDVKRASSANAAYGPPDVALRHRRRYD